MKKDKRKQKPQEGGAGRPAPSPIPPASVRVRMLRAIGTSRGSYQPGTVMEVPAATARSWLNAGIAEQDKMVDSVPETKQE